MSKKYVPSLFSAKAWEFNITSATTWKFDRKQWSDDDLIKIGPDMPQGDFGTASEFDIKRFFVFLARTRNQRDQVGDNSNLANLALFNPFTVGRPSPGFKAAVIASSKGGNPWFCLALKTSNLGDDIVTPQFAAALAPVTYTIPGGQARLPAFVHQLEDTATPVKPWYVLEASGPQTPQMAFDALNHAVREVAGTQHASLPFQGAVPTFQSDDPLEAFSLTELQNRTTGVGRAWSTRLRRVVFASGTKGRKVTAHLNWFHPHRDQDVTSSLTGFALKGGLADGDSQMPGQFAHRWVFEDPTIPPKVVELIAPGVHEDNLIASFKLTGCEVVDNDQPWLRLGSIEIRPHGKGSNIGYALRGDIGTGAVTVYPECTISDLECDIRTAPGSDPVAVWSQFSTTSASELRESAPIVAVDEAKIRTGKLSIKTKYERHRHATTELDLVVDGSADPGSALWINLRPFLVAKVDLPRNIDERAETRLTWRSDDPQGAQWRVEDSEVRLTLPPQAVGEEMERGIRFYQPGKTNSPIDPDHPVRYRFSRATSLTLLPSPPEQRRRFEKASLNLRELLRGSIVRKMVVEIAYPLEVTYTADDKRTILLTEVAEFLGQPAQVLPSDDTSVNELAYLSTSMGSYVRWHPAAHGTYKRGIEALAASQVAVWHNYTSRLAELHVHDPTRPRGEMKLVGGVSSRLRDTRRGARAATPLPADAVFDTNSDLGKRISPFYDQHGAWAEPARGGLRGGLIHSFELPSEMVEVLETPEAVATVIETLCLSALGATGKMEAAFASGKTTFAVVAAHGQLARLAKTRIGRIGALWNRAKHVVVYERTTSRSAQFKQQQASTADFDGWPILRKTEEYIEPIQMQRVFGEEDGADQNTVGFMHACFFATQRIYVDGAWARDFGDGYEMPLWDERAAAADPKFYPRPQICVQCHGEEDRLTRLWFKQPDRLYFYSSAVRGTSTDTDKWTAKAGIDYESNLPRMPAPTRPEGTDRLALQAPANPNLCLSRRFDLAVEAEGPVNLQYGRGATPMLVVLQRLSIGRGAQMTPLALKEMPDGLKDAHKTLQQTARVMQGVRSGPSAIEELRRRAEEILGRIVYLKEPCTDFQTELNQLIDKQVRHLGDGLNPLRTIELKDILLRGEAVWAQASAELSSELLQRGFLAQQIVDQRAKEARASIVELRGRVEQWADPINAEQRRVLDSLAAEIRVLALDVAQRATTYIEGASKGIQERLEDVAKSCNQARDEMQPAMGTLEQRCRAAEKQLAVALAKFEGLPASSRKLLDPCRLWVANAATALNSTAANAAYLDKLAAMIAQEIDASLRDLIEGVAMLASTLSEWATEQLSKAADAATTQLTSVSTNLSATLKELNDPPPPLVADVLNVLLRIEKYVDTSANGLTAVRRQVYTDLQTHLSLADGYVAKNLQETSGPIVKISNAIKKFTAGADAVVNELETTLKDLVAGAAGDCKKLLDKLKAETDKALAWAEQQARAAISDVLSTEAARQVEQYAAQAEKIWDVGSQAISLARAVGELPKITPLEFDINAADYVFDGKLPSIRMTPAVARLQQQGEKLLEALGVAMPCSELLDQLVPDIPADTFDFNKIFPKFAGMDFEGLFKRFRLPALDSNKLNITHGFDKTTRRAWVNSKVNFAQPEYEELFSFGPVALGLEKMRFDAFTGVETRFDGLKPLPPTVKTTAALLGDWTLLAGGQAVVTFRELAIKYDGASGFHFDVSPDNIELHPSLKFISEFVQQFKKDLPPAIEIVEENGRPVGVRASTTIVLDDLPDLGAVTIGPIDMRSSLGLKFYNGQFLINSAFSLGNKQMPIFVQISWLGGGCWLEAQATYVAGRVESSISVGLSVGSTRAFNLASVAKGSFNVQLYVYIDVLGSASRIAVGLSLVGSAVIVGFVNASLNLLLEAQHGGGETKGTGRLDVSVKISWVYTFRYKTSVNHKF